jgi:release factor glutamine methyltransferase
VTIKQALGHAREILTAANVEDASLEGELLIRHALKIDKVQLYLDFDRELSPEQEKTLRKLIERRRNREPTAYITGHREFYGLDFYVDPSVLIPRPESELLVEKALELARHCPVTTIADIGTGCGAIAVSLAVHLPEVKIYATDISAQALEITRINSQKHGVADRICLLQGDMLSPLPEPVDLIIANLPYVKESELARTGPASYEPAVALNGGSAGLEKIRQLSQQVGGKLHRQGCLLLEIGQGQGEAVSTFLRGLFPSAGIEVAPDLCGIERVVSLALIQLDTRMP